MSHQVSCGSRAWKVCIKFGINTVSVIGGVFLVTFAIPLTLILLSPFYIWRKFVILLARKYRPDLGRIMTTRSSIIGVDPIYEKPLANLVVKLIVDGNPEGTQVRAMAHKYLIEATEPSGQLLHPELQQSVVDWLGFKFWKWDPNFHINNHIKIVRKSSGSSVKECETYVEKMMLDFKENPFRGGASPWEWLIIENFSGETRDEKIFREERHPLHEKEERRKTTIILTRFHHSLVDGYSTTKLLLKSIGQLEKVELIRLDFKKKTKFEEALHFLAVCVKAPFELVKLSFVSRDENPWHKEEEELSRKAYIGFTQRPVPLDQFRRIKRLYNVSVTAVLLAAMTAAIRSSMIRTGVKPPKFINCGLPLPYPNHPSRLRNHMSVTMTRLPIGIENRQARLAYCHKQAKKLKVSTIPVLTFRLMPLIGALPSFMIKPLVNNRSTTALLSNFPGPFGTVVEVCGSPLEALHFCGGFGAGRTGIGFTGLSYMDKLLLGAQADQVLFPSKEIFLLMLQDFETELNAFLLEKNGDIGCTSDERSTMLC